MKSYSKNNTYAVLLFALLLSSCEKFVQLDAPKNSITPSSVFKSNDIAASAVLGLYERMAAGDFASGNSRSISTLASLAADEFVGYGGDLILVQNNQILPDNPSISSLWTSMYARIYGANGIMEGLEKSDFISPPVKDLLHGEALFCRAFCYFYLVNLYGPVPLNLSTDYLINVKAKRTAVADIYLQILNDLTAAAALLPETYIGAGRIRPNKSTIYALLARTYFYLGDWDNAEKYSSLVIDNSLYKLVPLDQVFLSTSSEAIWQLYPTAGGNTPAGNLLILTSAPSGSQVSLSPEFVNSAFEAGDPRKASWVKNITVANVTYYYPFKYKIRSATTVTESIMVFRLAEQYLIRAEAKARQHNLAGAVADLDEIRKRAGLPLLRDIDPNIQEAALISAILKERRVELFSEWGDRWFDLKRRNKSTSILSPIKQDWKPEYVLFPIPKIELDGNINMDQNEGY